MINTKLNIYKYFVRIFKHFIPFSLHVDLHVHIALYMYVLICNLKKNQI